MGQGGGCRVGCTPLKPLNGLLLAGCIRDTFCLITVLQQITAHAAIRGAHGATESPLHALFLLSALFSYAHRPPPASVGRCCRLHVQGSVMRQIAWGMTDGAGLA